MIFLITSHMCFNTLLQADLIILVLKIRESVSIYCIEALEGP
jgi:hypothetical protein